MMNQDPGTMSSKRKRYIAIAFAISLVILLYPVEKASACYGKDVMLGMGGSAEASAAPTISTGENKVTSNVSVTYEIR